MNIHTLQAKNLKAGYNKTVIIDGIDVTIPSNKISVIIGSNGCGKSTLLKNFARLIKPFDGEILLDGAGYDKMHSKDLAKIIGLLPQSPMVPESITVYDLVARGRYPYQKPFSQLTSEDQEAIEEAMEMMGVSKLRDQFVEELSGGQRQRVWIAMALAQQTDILFLDEPTTFLDISYQVQILELLKNLNEKKGTTIVMVLHDINLASRYADCLFAMKNGELIAAGSPEDILNEELMLRVFNLECILMKDPVSGSPFIVPKGRAHLRPESQDGGKKLSQVV